MRDNSKFLADQIRKGTLHLYVHNSIALPFIFSIKKLRQLTETNQNHSLGNILLCGISEFRKQSHRSSRS